LRGLALSAHDLKNLNPEWSSAMIEDYLSLLENFITIANLLDVEIDQKLEEVSTDFTNGSIPFVSGGFLAEDNANLFWDAAAKILQIGGIIQSEGRIKGKVRLTFTDSPYNIDIVDEVIYADTDGGPIVLNLPAGTDGETHKITNTGTTHNDVTLNPNGAELLNGFNDSEIIKDSETFDLDNDSTEGWWI